MATPNHIPLSELLREVKETLVERFMAPRWVTAEIAEIKCHASGHCYLDLVEKGSKEGIPKAEARAVIWRNNYLPIAERFTTETGQTLTAGLQILASVLVSYHERFGFSLQIINIDPAYTLGDMERQRHETIARLQEEGIWELNKQQALPPLVQRLAILSSAQAAGYRDLMKELERSPYAFRTTLFEAAMQGEQAEGSLIAALDRVAAQQEEFDAVVIVRGGGSTSDLNCFNAYRLCNYIAQFPLPVITGIGHDKDQSVADLVAHTALKTPTAVGGWLTERMATIERWLEGAALQLNDTVLRRMRSEELRLERLRSDLQQRSREGMLHARLHLEQQAAKLPEAVAHRFEREQLRLKGAVDIVESRSPQRILQLGFAIVRGGGEAIRSIEELKRHKQLQIELADGSVEIKN